MSDISSFGLWRPGSSQRLEVETPGGPLLPARCADLLGAATPPVPVTGGVLADEALAVLQDAAAR